MYAYSHVVRDNLFVDGPNDYGKPFTRSTRLLLWTKILVNMCYDTCVHSQPNNSLLHLRGFALRLILTVRRHLTWNWRRLIYYFISINLTTTLANTLSIRICKIHIFTTWFPFYCVFLKLPLQNGQTNCSILLNSTWISELQSIILLYEIFIHAEKSCDYHITSKQ